SKSMTSAGVSMAAAGSPTRAGGVWAMAVAGRGKRLLYPARRALSRGLLGRARRGFGGLGRRELPVDEAADREHLRAVDLPRQRIGAIVVDPVVDADAVLDRVAERRLALAGALAHHQRQPLLVGVLVDEQRGGLLVARDEPAADERIAEAVE